MDTVRLPAGESADAEAAEDGGAAQDAGAVGEDQDVGEQDGGDEPVQDLGLDQQLRSAPVASLMA